jgi:diguanylate cyclase (GGDEF)-like protein/PAS domain S-box-containing protein
MFKLLRYFSLASAIAIVFVTAALLTFYHRYSVSNLVEFGEGQNVALARSFANTLWLRFGKHIKSVSDVDPDTLRQHPRTRELNDAIRIVIAGLPVLKVKIFNLDGVTVYSSASEEIGEDVTAKPGFIAAARQEQTVSQLGFRNTFNVFEETVHERDLVESYLPIRNAAGLTEGVFELYADVTPLMAKVEDTTVKLAIGLVCAFGLLYGALFLIVRHADGIIAWQYRDLEATEENIRKQNQALQAEIIARVVAQEALRESEESLRSIVDNAGDAIFVHNSEGWIVEANPAACRMTGCGRDELIKMRVVDITSDRQGLHLQRDWTRITPGYPMTYEDVHRRMDGSTFPVEVRMGVYKSGDKPLIVLIVRDVTQRKKAEDRIRHMASHDVLTDLPNRNLFLDRLLAALAAARRNKTLVGVLFVDLDDFKRINDTLGHEAGDLLLVETANRLTAGIREMDTVGRHGGDEFVIALTSVTDRDGVFKVADKIIATVSRSFIVGGVDASCTCSIGIALYPDHGETPEDLLKCADVAMYQAKDQGRNVYQLASLEESDAVSR